MMACVFNFAGSEHTRYRLGLPQAGTWHEVLNSDATVYNGTGIGNMGAVQATENPWHGRPASAELVLPPNSALWLEPREASVQRVGQVAAAGDHDGVGGVE
jgi:1,4-alpha-glucan branching enzyme